MLLFIVQCSLRINSAIMPADAFTGAPLDAPPFPLLQPPFSPLLSPFLFAARTGSFVLLHGSHILQ